MLLSELLEGVLIGFSVRPAFSAVDSRMSSKNITRTELFSWRSCIVELY